MPRDMECSTWQSNTAAPLIEGPCKRHLTSERWGAASKAQVLADAVLLNPVSSTDWSISSLQPVPVSQKAQGDQSLPLPSSKQHASYQESHTNTSFPQRERPPSPSLLSHQEREEHQSWNKGTLDTFWSSWPCSRHYTDQQPRLSKNEILKHLIYEARIFQMKGKSGEEEGIGFPQTHNSAPLGL